MRPSWRLVDRLIVWGFDVAIAFDRWLDERKGRKRGLSFGESLAEHARRNAKTRIIPRDKRQ